MNKDYLKFEYDKVGDIFYLSKVLPYKEQNSDEIEDGVIARMNPVTDEIESLEILNFSKKCNDQNSFSLPIIAKFIKSA